MYGYARVSTDGQRVDAQVRQLTKAGCKKGYCQLDRRRRLPGIIAGRNRATNPYAGYRYPTEIISHAVWLYFHVDTRLVRAQAFATWQQMTCA